MTPREIIEGFARRHSRHTSTDGRIGLSTNGDPLLVAAFAVLGWSDPHLNDAVPEAAVVEAPERAVMPKPKRRIW